MGKRSDYAQLSAKAFASTHPCFPPTERNACSHNVCTPKQALDTVCPFFAARSLAKIRPDWGSSVSIESRELNCKSVYAQNKSTKHGRMKPMEANRG